MKRIVCFVLCLALSVALLLPGVLAAQMTNVHSQSVPLSDRSVLVNQTSTLPSGAATKSIQENYILYQKENAVFPIVAFGTTLFGRSSMSALASQLKDAGLSLVAAINGSFFDFTTGIPYGAVITDGILRTSGDVNSVGFYADGTAVIGKPSLRVELLLPDGSATLIEYNKALTKDNGIILYSQDYDYKTKNTIPAYHLVLRPRDGTHLRLTPEDSVVLEVTGIMENTKSCTIPDDCYLLAIAEDSIYETALRQMKTTALGSLFEVHTTVARAWDNVVYACGGGDLLVENGAACVSFTLDTANQSRARTAVGIRKDESLVFYTVDEHSASAGLTLPELAERMQQLGCVTALNLDGGGSTALGATFPGYASAATVNTPSDGSLRECANFIYLVRRTTEKLAASRLHVYPYGALILPGAQIPITLKASDANYLSVEPPAAVNCYATGGAVDKGVLTVAPDVTSATVNANCGALHASVTYTVLDKITGITLRRSGGSNSLTKLHVGGGSKTELSAIASYYGKGVYAQNESFIWSADAAIGTVSASGVFTAKDVSADVTGELTVSYGSFTKTLPIIVSPANPFADVKGHWAEDYINDLYYNGILTGSVIGGKLCYRPDASMTRQEFIVALMRALQTNLAGYAKTELPFDDVEKISDWAMQSVQAAYSLGYMSGSETGGKLLANPTSTISRQEAMVILARAMNLTENADTKVLEQFSDAFRVADWAKEALAAMVRKNVISGSNGRLNPTGNLTRAEVAKLLAMTEG